MTGVVQPLLHGAQPSTVSHQQLPQPKQETISLLQTPLTVQYSTFPKAFLSAPSSITVTVSTQDGPLVHNMQIHQTPGGHINVQKVAKLMELWPLEVSSNMFKQFPPLPLGPWGRLQGKDLQNHSCPNLHHSKD